MKVILFLLFSLNVYAVTYDEFADLHVRGLDNTLTIPVIPTSYPLVWEKPRELIFSLIKNQYWFPKTRSSLGHVSAEVNCTINGERQQYFSGQSTQSLNGFREHLKAGYGFAILNRPMNNYPYPLITIQGKLDNFSEMKKRYDGLIAKDHLSFLTLKLSEGACKNILEYMKEYEYRTKKTPLAGNRYGFGADPKNFDGAGCAPFVQTLFQLAELDFLSEVMERTVYIPESLIGDPKKNKKVSLWTLLTSSHDMSIEDKNLVKFSFPDPQMLYDFIHLKEKRVGNFYPILDEKLISGEKVKFLLLDVSKASVNM